MTTFSSIKRAPAGPIRLSPVTGPELAPVTLDPTTGTTGALIGKEPQCRVRLDHPAVSRRHAVLEVRNDEWFLTDLGSRNGTFVNGQRLEGTAGVPVAHGDQIRISPWVFRAALGRTITDKQTTEDQVALAGRVEPVERGGTRTLAPVHLDGLIKASGAIYSAPDEPALWEALLGSVLHLTGFQRGAIVREGRDASSVEVRARRSRDGGSAEFEISRTLVRAAAAGKSVHLRGSSQVTAHSLVSQDVSDAVCVPLAVDGAVWGFMYLDSRGHPVVTEATQVSGLLGEMGSLALANVLRRDMESRFASLRREAELAAEAQRLLLPPEEGRIGGMAYAFRFRPGRLVSGDIMGIVQLGTGRTAAFLGDVTGKGFGAGLVMTLIQSYLSASLLWRNDPAAAMNMLNAHLAQRMPPGCYASLWLGVFDEQERSLKIVDAGHGLALLIEGGRPRRLETQHGTWLGVAPDTEYQATTVSLRPGARVLVCSDGLVEQPSAEGAEFGMERMMRALASSPSVAEDVERVLRAVDEFSPGSGFRDDLTVAAFSL
jgi:sigma-B regulation protein RsbU (phosphoserine phosphatase)